MAREVCRLLKSLRAQVNLSATACRYLEVLKQLMLNDLKTVKNGFNGVFPPEYHIYDQMLKFYHNSVSARVSGRVSERMHAQYFADTRDRRNGSRPQRDRAAAWLDKKLRVNERANDEFESKNNTRLQRRDDAWQSQIGHKCGRISARQSSPLARNARRALREIRRPDEERSQLLDESSAGEREGGLE